MKLIPILILLLFSQFSASAQSAEEIMSSVRQVTGLQPEQDLHGELRRGSKKVPFSILLRGKDIHFQINKGQEAFALKMGPTSQHLFETTGGKARHFPPAKIGHPIAQTNVSYEDLALKFLYWPNPRIAGEDKIKGQDCWRIHMANPESNGRYREVSVWVSKKQRALMRVIGYGAKPKRAALKQFEVTDIMKRKGGWTAKTLKVSGFNEKGKSEGTTYLDFGKKKRLRR